MRKAVDRTVGETAVWCMNCLKDGVARTGRAVCVDERRGDCNACPFALPQLDPYRTEVLHFFLVCARAHAWVRSDFSGVRRYIDPARLRLEAEFRGVELSEFFLDKFAICESVIAEQDAVRAEAASKPDE
jgi:hypothetical protein